MVEDFKKLFPYEGLNNLPTDMPGDFGAPPSALASIGLPQLSRQRPTPRANSIAWVIGNSPTAHARLSDQDIHEIVEKKKRSPTLRCLWCSAPTAGTYYPYCPDCYKKSLDPKGGVPPIPAIIDPRKLME